MIAYIILAHRGPAQVARLIERLADEDVRFFLHIDRKVDESPFHSALPAATRSQVRWVERVDARWGDYSLVQATLNGLHAVGANGLPFHHVVLLSGQSYPLKPNREIHASLASQAGCSLMTCSAMPPDKMCRLDRYYYHLRGWRRVYPPPLPAHSLKEQLVNALCRVRFRMPRRHPDYAPPHFGSQWWCLSAEAVTAIEEFLRAHPDYTRFHRYSDVPDEMFFQTILAAESARGRAGTLLNRDVQYTDWDDERRPSPRVLTVHDFDRLAASDCLFARKFDETIDSAILDEIDRRVLGNPPIEV